MSSEIMNVHTKVNHPQSAKQHGVINLAAQLQQEAQHHKWGAESVIQSSLQTSKLRWTRHFAPL